MRGRRASTPWHDPTSTSKRGRPQRLQLVRSPGCMWPLAPSPAPVCGKSPAEGLALCKEHAKALDLALARTCVWPGCAQTPFHGLCGYHVKIALGLCEPLTVHRSGGPGRRRAEPIPEPEPPTPEPEPTDPENGDND